jgi:hypothetical protein
MMEDMKLYKKAIFGVIFVIGAIIINGAFNNAMAQTENQSQLFPNNTETSGELGSLLGSDQSIMTNNTSISNPNNTLENSLATNENQSN